MSCRPTPESSVSGENGTRIFPSGIHPSVRFGNLVLPLSSGPSGSLRNAYSHHPLSILKLPRRICGRG